MRQTSYRWCLPFLLLLLLSALAQPQQLPTLRISGTAIQSTELSAKDMEQMPRLSLDIQEAHHGEMQHYEGVRLSDLLAKAGVPLGDKLRGRAMAIYVLARGSDGYAVVYSLAELDPAMTDNRIMVADRMNGKSLDSKEGPFKVVVPGDKRPARWIRMLTALQVENAVSPSESCTSVDLMTAVTVSPGGPPAITSGILDPNRMQACVTSKAPVIPPPTAIAHRAFLFPDVLGAESPIIRCPLSHLLSLSVPARIRVHLFPVRWWRTRTRSESQYSL